MSVVQNFNINQMSGTKPDICALACGRNVEFSACHKRHFRHDRLNRGICLHWCKPNYHEITSSDKPPIREKCKNETDITLDLNFVAHGLDDHINMCINKELSTGYNLMANSKALYCITNHDTHETDSLDWLFIVLFAGMVILLISSTLCDFFMRRRNLEHNNSMHYQVPVKGKHASLMVSFSLPRNWYRLMAQSNNKINRDLRSIQAIRVMALFCIMLGHSAMYMNIMPTSNPQYMEKNYYRIVTQLMINGSTIIQSFFAMSGFLLSVLFMQLRKTHKFSLHYFWKAIIYRYIRLTPVYMFVIFFNATWLITVQDGPIWPYVAGTERANCRKNAWTHLLYVNNMLEVKEPCSQHTWYLATEFQMFIVGVAMHLILWKYPRSKRILINFSILATFLVPGIVNYSNKFEGTFMSTPEKQRRAHWNDIMYVKSYMPAYTNFGSYLCGMIGGIMYCKYKQQEENTQSKAFKVFQVIWYVSQPISLLALLSGFIFYEYDFIKPAIWIAFCSAAQRIFWGAWTTIFVTGIALGIGWTLREIMCYPVFRTLGRLSYCAYLVHPTVIRIFFGNQRQPLYYSYMHLTSVTLTYFLVSYVAALLLSITVEFPVSALQGYFFKKDFDTAASKNQDISVDAIRPIHYE